MSNSRRNRLKYKIATLNVFTYIIFVDLLKIELCLLHCEMLRLVGPAAIDVKIPEGQVLSVGQAAMAAVIDAPKVTLKSFGAKIRGPSHFLLTGLGTPSIVSVSETLTVSTPHMIAWTCKRTGNKLSGPGELAISAPRGVYRIDLAAGQRFVCDSGLAIAYTGGPPDVIVRDHWFANVWKLLRKVGTSVSNLRNTLGDAWLRLAAGMVRLAIDFGLTPYVLPYLARWRRAPQVNLYYPLPQSYFKKLFNFRQQSGPANDSVSAYVYKLIYAPRDSFTGPRTILLRNL